MHDVMGGLRSVVCSVLWFTQLQGGWSMHCLATRIIHAIQLIRIAVFNVNSRQPLSRVSNLVTWYHDVAHYGVMMIDEVTLVYTVDHYTM